MRQFWKRLGRFSFPSLLPVPRRRTRYQEGLFQRAAKAERQVAIAEDTINGLIGQVEDLTRALKKAKDSEALAEAQKKIDDLQRDNAALFYAAQKAKDNEIAAQVQIGALESELKAVQKVFEKQSRHIYFHRSCLANMAKKLQEQMSIFEEEWNARTKQEAGRKDHHQRVNHDHGGANPGESSLDRDRGAEDRGGQPGGGSAA